MTKSRIMLVEDDSTMLSLLGTLLNFEGFDVVQVDKVDTLNEIVSKVRSERPELILLDVNLRKLDGFEVLAIIRDDMDLRSIRVLMSSGMDFTDRCAQEGADGFILKPYMPEDLIDRIRQTLAE